MSTYKISIGNSIFSHTAEVKEEWFSHDVWKTKKKKNYQISNRKKN